jgi:hypothetical protein
VPETPTAQPYKNLPACACASAFRHSIIKGLAAFAARPCSLTLLYTLDSAQRKTALSLIMTIMLIIRTRADKNIIANIFLSMVSLSIACKNLLVKGFLK